MALTAILAVGVAGCGGQAKQRADSVAAVQMTQAADSLAKSPCAPTGWWKACNLTERLIRAGLGVRLDSAPAHEGLPGTGLLYHIGHATLAVYLYADSAARKAAVAKLDTSDFIGYEATQVYPPKKSLIQSANLASILLSQSGEQRQRIGDAITAGPPQPPRK